MNIKKLVLSCSFLAAGVLGTGIANATCTTYGQVEQVYTNGGTGWTYAYVSSASVTGLPLYYYYFATNNAKVSSALQSSLHKNVYIWGNAASCPTTGSLRFGGSTLNVYVN